MKLCNLVVSFIAHVYHMDTGRSTTPHPERTKEAGAHLRAVTGEIFVHIPILMTSKCLNFGKL